MSTIKDVAREAGVSVTTVSHVVNATRPVAPETRERVSDVIRRLGYRPSGIARALKANRTHAIGMLVTTSVNPFFAEVMRGVEAGCFERGYTLILGNTGDVAERLEAYWHTLAARRIDGLVVMTTNASPDFLQQLDSNGVLPVVALDTAEGLVDCVINDDSEMGGRLAGRFLVERGFRRIGCITGPAGHPRGTTRLEAFRAGLTEAGAALDPALVVRSDFTIAGGYRALGELAARPGPLPDALFCINDMLAIGALCAAHERGLRVPDDLSVMGYDDSEIAAYTAPPLTTIRQPAFEMGQAAARVLIEHLDSGTPLPHMLALPPELVERRSVRPRVQ
ncbi:LacI family DNA-binding transcriptional regulator [Labrys wisconsinensis]|uniref:LacI family transcriptional regulator n=1 Tax=Labrys wisconsinensis TaxID=425677 RepID=A0ABU0JAS7_9HYPH|nr:LacI family DNA-binding transcriptional regulator [Labrys wisconsinensis]MDQ0471371.1 LacI family transcriptional regulator [Labrys wisconsinensis]